MPDLSKEELSGWGRYPRRQCRVMRPAAAASIEIVDESQVIARGAGRSYGDAAISSDGLVLLTEKINQQITLDSTDGTLRADSGVSLADVLKMCVPEGWFPTVTPGTKFVTLGGCVAADVHGKNHHRAGTFAAHVSELEIILADGSRISCSPKHNSDLFNATTGGMGLTGIISTVTCNLRRIETAQMLVRHQPARNLDHALELIDDAQHDDEHKVCWLDSTSKGSSLGRGVLITGHHALGSELPAEFVRGSETTESAAALRIPIDFPSWILNPFTANIFNRFYFHKQSSRREPFVADIDAFFYPLDAITDWNRLYGRRGFVQYQCVLPDAEAAPGFSEMFQLSAQRGLPSFLSVLKRFGAEGTGLLSFPMRGYSLSLDFPVRDAVFDLLAEFDQIVEKRGGRVYLAKDACLKPESFRRMYPRLNDWLAIKKQFDPSDRFCSDLSKRLGICN